MAHSKVRTRTTRQHAAENTGYTYSLSSSYSSSALDYEREHKLAPVFDSPRMSRRSLRLNSSTSHYRDDSLLDSSHSCSISYSTGGSVHKENKTLKSRRSRSTTSGSGSLLQTPVKNQSNSVLQAHNSSLHSFAASDASLLSSLLDESCIQERTLIDSVWGLDEDGDLKDRTLRTDRSFTSVNNSDMSTTQTQTFTVTSGYICKDCTAGSSDNRDALPTYSSSKPCSSSSCSYSSSTSALHNDARDGASSPYTTVYSREKSRRHRSGLLRLVFEACLHCSRKAAASVVLVFALLMQNILPKTDQQGKAMLWSVTDWCASLCKKVASSSAAALTLLTRSAGLRAANSVNANGGHAGYCGTMNVNELVTQKEHQNLSGPLCDDCKGKQNLKTCTVYTWRSRAQQLLGVLWFLFVFTGSGLLKAEQRLLSAGYFVTRKILSFLYLAAVSPGKAASGAFWWLGTAWYQLVTLMSLLNVFFLTRCLPILRKILLILLLFLLLLALWYWGLSSLWAILPVANKTMRATNSLLSFPSAQTPMDKGSESQPGSGPSYTHHEQDMTLAAAAYSERLTQIEQSLTQLWERVVASGSRQEQRHEEVLSLYTSIRDQLHTHTDRESMGQWVSTLMEQRVSLLRKQLEKEKQQSQQHQEEFEQESQTQKSRLAEVETLLKNLALKTEELQRRQDSEVPSSVSGDVEDASRLTLLAEVRRLEETLESIRTDLQGVMGCKGRCEQLDSLHDTVSEQVRLELRSLLYGREQPEGAELPDSVLQWLSTRFVSNSDLQASLISLERSILHNVSIQLEQMQQKPSAETVTSAVRKTTDEAGLSEENVQLIVKNALKLYSQDRIGLVDYALESGGGSVLSTRCSETYETKTALMSLFGLPLWYFSQSPRVVIQPDVHPGNCWAFRGSHGYLVIRLSMKIIPTAFSLEHIPKTLSPTGNISSAPRNFTVYGLDDEQQEEGQVLGRYVYQEDGEPLQTYPVKENGTNAYQIIELRVLSNWGHPEYTCLYRFRVHGKPTQQ
ncbi:SUN domain-containing protein 1 isoform X3 [Pygocentrus nattereri]|uniref:SUN domain-containing protein 1 isoform X3 n=1 Tax=Pygocentrus nattereri TaxID=42514 RepID=UPI0018911C51|nr:SUN domain-containing protein 1 isoform X3 [Pygocentrus nattereri]XP_017539716.2 SUN domain-containing protein 1 isoform X3 [Pygocentrus nattereri]